MEWTLIDLWKDHKRGRFFLKREASAGYTLIEMVVVLMIIGTLFAVLSVSGNAIKYWRQESAIRQLSETITFLYRRAISDRVQYRLEFNMDPNKPFYKIGELVPENISTEAISGLLSAGAGVGTLSLELATLLTPLEAEYENLIPPRSFPSLAKPVDLPEGMQFEDIVTPRGKHLDIDLDGTRPYVTFSPRGFSEFAAIHLTVNEESSVTIAINPYTGLTDIYREYKEFTEEGVLNDR